MGYKIRTPGVQIFLRYKMLKWGTVPPNGVQLAGLLSTSISSRYRVNWPKSGVSEKPL